MKDVLITGATAGIGRACAELFARTGWRVTAVARSEADLAELKRLLPEGSVEVVAVDLAGPEGWRAVPSRDYEAIVLNAAVFRPGGLLDPEEDIFSDSWLLNVRANHLLARAQVPGMVSRSRGSLVVVGSVGTDDWPEGLSAYVATKYALRGLFLGWQQELAGTGVRAAMVAPGATQTRSWAGETELPADILEANEVAGLIMRVVREGLTGRHVLRGSSNDNGPYR